MTDRSGPNCTVSADCPALHHAVECYLGEFGEARIFASTPPRNTDTHPWLHDHHWACSDNGGRFRTNNGIGNIYDPRPEFDQPRAHDANPILVAYRKHLETHRLTSDADAWLFAIDSFEAFGGYTYWDIATHVYHPITVASRAHIEHARKVLRKLEALS